MHFSEQPWVTNFLFIFYISSIQGLTALNYDTSFYTWSRMEVEGKVEYECTVQQNFWFCDAGADIAATLPAAVLFSLVPG